MMKGTSEAVKGYIEEVAGVLAGSEKLRVQGQCDQITGNLKAAVETSGKMVVEAIPKPIRKIVKKVKKSK